MSAEKKAIAMIEPACSQSIARLRPKYLVAIAVVALATGASLAASAQSPSSTSASSSISEPTVAAIIAFAGVMLSAVVAWFAAHAAVRSEHAKRQSELALKISDMVSAADEPSRRSAMRRFAVGFVKVVEPEDHEEWGKVHFIPMNARVTVGRSDDNDIVLKDDELTLSRWHCGFIADQRRVWLDDYGSLNGSAVGGDKLSESRELKSGDIITLGITPGTAARPYKLHFRAIHPNTILAQ